MARRHLESKLSHQNQELDEVWGWYDFQYALIGEEAVRAIQWLESENVTDQTRYFGRTKDELETLFAIQREELDKVVMLQLLAATEAKLKVDYIMRVISNRKDALSICLYFPQQP